MRITHREIALVALLVWVSALTGCATKRNVFQQGGTTVKLASKRGEKLGLNHPIQSSSISLCRRWMALKSVGVLNSKCLKLIQ